MVDTIRVNLDNTPYTSKADAKRHVGTIRRNLRTVDISPRALVDAILGGCTHTPAALDGTTGNTWRSQQLWELDFDNDDRQSPYQPAQIIEILAQYELIPLVVYYSFSHTPERPKFRVLLLSDTPCTSAEDAHTIRAGLVALMQGRADDSCTDAARLYFGTNKGAAMQYSSKSVPLSHILNVCRTILGDLTLTTLLNPPAAQPPANAPLTRINHLDKTQKTAKTPQKHNNNVDLGQAIKNFDLAAYIERDKGVHPKLVNGQKCFNPCPICGHNDDFYVSGGQFICFSAHGLAGKGGNIITYLEHTRNISREDARSYFLHDILQISTAKSVQNTPVPGLPSVGTAEPNRAGVEIAGEALTESLLRTYLNNKKITIKYNVLTKSIDFSGNLYGIARGDALNLIPIMLADELRQQRIKGATTQTVRELLTLIAGRDRYNPVADYLTATQWDRVNRLPTIYSILGISDDPAYRTYVSKWLLQCVAMGLNNEDNPLGAEGVLVLAGAQGVGKTAFFRRLTPHGLFVEGASIDTSSTGGGRDSIVRATSGWICELGELDSTTKREQPALKSLITSPIDRFRLPYAAADTQAVRHTSFCGTVNGHDFLVDSSGSRRFWVIPVQELDKRGIFTLLEPPFVAQLWAQMYALYIKQGAASFRLNDAEMETLQHNNRAYESALPWEIDIVERLNYDAEPDKWRWITAATLKTLGVVPLSADTRAVGRALQKIIATLEQSELMPQNVAKLAKTVKGIKQYFLPIS